MLTAGPRPGRRRLRRAAVVALAGAFTAMVLSVLPATADTTHVSHDRAGHSVRLKSQTDGSSGGQPAGTKPGRTSTTPGPCDQDAFTPACKQVDRTRWCDAWWTAMSTGGNVPNAAQQARYSAAGCSQAMQNAVVSRAALAQRAVSTLRLPDPVMHRSPVETARDNGQPFTWINLWTWYWADQSVWHNLTARAQAGPVWVQATATPTRMIIDPGDGHDPITCTGPGRAWLESDGNDPPPAGACGYRYRHVAATPVTARMSIEWIITWVASDGTRGALDPMRTDITSSYLVEQIQIVTR